MFSTRLTVWISVFLLLLSPLFGLGVFEEDGSFTFYTSESNPQINVSLLSNLEEIRVQHANLTLNESESTLPINENLLIGEEGEFEFFKIDFGFTETFTQNDFIFFELFALGVDDTEIETIEGSDPTEFQIKIDQKPVQLAFPLSTEQQIVSAQNQLFKLDFNEKIQKLSLFNNNQLIAQRVIDSQFKLNYPQSFSFTTEELSLLDGPSTLRIEATDLAGNTANFSRSVFVLGLELQVSLLTRKDNANLNYFYDSSRLELFEGKIFSSEESFTFQVQTNKQATCFFSDSLLNFEDIEQVENKVELQSSDELTHSITLNTAKTKRFWLACHGRAGFEDTAYLSESMGLGQVLIGLEKYTGAELQILESEPASLLTRMPTKAFVKTNEEASCSFRINTGAKISLNSGDFLIHNSSSFTRNSGSFDLTLSCRDKVGIEKTKTTRVNFDPSQGIKILNVEPEFADKQAVEIKLTLSEDALCKISKEKEFLSEFNNITTTLSGTGTQRDFQATGLSQGENEFFVYCQRGNNVFEEVFNIFFDKEGPRIANLTFISNGEPSDFLGSTKRIEYEFEVQSTLDIEDFFFRVSFENESEVETFTRSNEEGTLTGDFLGARELVVVAQDVLGRNSTELRKTILFDVNAPILSITPIGDSLTITCSDSDSGCFKVFYGFSEDALSCSPQIKIENGSVEKGELPFICARALDKVGNVREEGLLLETDSDFDIDDLFNETNSSTSNPENSDEENESPEEEEEEDVEPFIPSLPETSEEEGGNLILIAGASLLLLLLVGGGGYGAYKKGYLNKQLEKMGIHTQESTGSGQDYYSGAKHFEEDSKKTESSLGKEHNNKTSGKSAYDHHLKDLNTFIDETLNKKKKNFEAFDSDKKGKESLMKSSSKTTSQDMDFDEFYKHSKQEHHRGAHSEEKIDTHKKLKEEAGNFEEFHNKKKESDKKEESKDN